MRTRQEASRSRRGARRALPGLTALGVALLATAGPAAAAPGWQPPQRVTAEGAQGSLPRAALDRDGNAFVVWTESREDVDDRLLMMERPAGGGWSAPRTVDTVPTAAVLAGPADAILGGDVAVTPAGTVLAAWTRRVGGALAIRSTARAPGGEWGPAEDGPAVTVGSLEITPGGDAMAIGGRTTASRPAGGGWGPAEVIPGATGVSVPQLALDRSGTAIAAWLRDLICTPKFGRQDPICASVGFDGAARPVSGPWGAAEGLLYDGDLGGIAIDPSGTATAVYNDDSEPGALFAIRRPPGGRWGSPELVARPGGPGDVGVDAAGNEIAVWSQSFFPTVDPGTGQVTRLVRIEASTRGPGGTWSEPEVLAEAPGGVRGAPRIAVSALGGAIVAWTRLDAASNFRVEAVARPPGGAWTVPAVLSSGSAVAHEVAIDADADGAVTWVQVTPGIVEQHGFVAVHEFGPPPAGPEARAARCAAPPPAPAGEDGDREGRGASVAVTAAQLRTNQRIGQAAIRRLNAVEAWLDAGIERRDLCGAAIGARELGPGSTTIAPGPLEGGEPAAADPRPVTVARAPQGGRGQVRLAAGQLLINQRIYQAAIRRAAALEERLAGRLTGGDLENGAVSQAQLAERLLLVRPAGGQEPAPSRTVVAEGPRRDADGVSLSAGQLIVNQRIAQAAVRRANALVARLEAGLTGAAFAPGSITAADLAPGLLTLATLADSAGSG